MPEILQIGSEVDISGFESLNSAYQQSIGSQTQMVESIAELTAAMSSLEEKIGEVIAVKERDIVENEKEALSLKEVQEAAMKTGEALKGAMGGISGLGAAIGIGVFAELISHLKEEALELGHLSEATGISIGKLTQLKDAMGAAGVETSRLPMQMTQLASAMEAAADGSQKQVDSFARLGVNTDAWAEKMPSELEVLNQVADHMKTSSDATADLAAARALFGRNVVGLTGFLKEGSAAIKEQEERFKEHGEAMQEAAESAKALQAQEAMLKADLETALMPAFQGVVTFLGLFEAGLIKVKAALEIVGRAVMGFGQMVVDQMSGTTSAMKEFFSGNFSKAAEISKQTSQTMRDDWSIASADIGSTWDTANKKADDLLAKLEAVKHGGGAEEGGPGKPIERKGDKEAAQERLNIQRQIGEAEVKLREDQAKQALEVHKAFDELELAQSGLAQSKSLADKATFADAQHTMAKQFAEDDFNIQKTGIDEKYSIDVASLNKMLALHTSNGAEDKKLREKLSGDLILLATTHKDELVRIKTAEDLALLSADAKYATDSGKIAEEKKQQEMKAAEQAIKTQETAIDGQVKALQAGATREIAELASKAKLHQITATQEFAQSQEINDREYMQAVELLKKKEQLFIQEAQMKAQAEGRTLTESEAKQLEGYAKINNELLTQYDAYLKRKQSLDDQAEAHRQQMWDKSFHSLNQGLVQAGGDWIRGTKTMSEAMGQMFGNIEQQLGTFIANWLLKKAEMWLMDAILGKTTQTISATGQITSNAAVAASGAFAATAAIPIIGPELAPAAAASAFAETMSFIGLAAAEHGAVLPQDMLILAHRNEMILPPALSSGMQSMISGGTAPGAQQPSHTTVNHYNISAMDGQDVHRVLMKNKDSVAQSVKAGANAGHLSARDFAR